MLANTRQITINTNTTSLNQGLLNAGIGGFPYLFARIKFIIRSGVRDAGVLGIGRQARILQ
jgi:hypothetical protein